MAVAAVVLLSPLGARVQDVEKIGSDACVSCHEESDHKTKIADDLSHSIHKDLGCLDCHTDKGTFPHAEVTDRFVVAGSGACGTCHVQEADDYKMHGRARSGANTDLPRCSSCHDGHDVLPSRLQASRTHPSRLPATCGTCHENIHVEVRHPDCDTGKDLQRLGARPGDAGRRDGCGHLLGLPRRRGIRAPDPGACGSDLDDLPVQHPGDLRQVSQGDRGRVPGGDSRAARAPGPVRRSRLHLVSR
jgi:hypothetical protein